MAFIGGEDDADLTYFKVLHSGGLVVRCEPNLTSLSTGRVISCESVVTTRKNLWKDGENFFIEVSEGGWVVVKRGPLNACARISGPDIKNGEWSYEVIHPSGSRFAKSPNISEASDRYEKVHQRGTIIKAMRKRTDIGSVITMVQLEADNGWIFEHASTGQVLDRLGNELVVIPMDSNREFRDFVAQVVNIDGINILTTPTETSVWRGRIEKDKLIQCCEILTVPLHSVESDGDNGGAGTGSTTIVGITEYFRLKDKKGWVVAMRKSKEWNLPEGSVCKKPAVYIVDVAEISCSQSSSLPTAPSSSSVSHDDEENASGRISTSTSSQLVPISHKFDGTGTGTGTGSQPVVCTTNDPVPGSDSRSHLNALVDKTSEIKEKLPNDQVNEDSPHAAWYRIIYKGGIRLRRSCSMHDMLEGTLPVGCFVKASRRVVTQSWTSPNRGTEAGHRAVTATADSERDKQKETETGEELRIGKGKLAEKSEGGGDITVFLQLLACVGAKVRVADAWIFETITHSDPEKLRENSMIVAAERVDEPKVESQPGLVMMVLYPGGITLRASPHMSAAKVDHIVKMYECHTAQGMISTADGMESFALLGGGAWLPCKAPGGLEVAVRVPRMPSSREGHFEITMRKDCQTLYGPFPDTPILPHVLPKGIVLQFDVLMWYPSLDGNVSASNIFLKLQQNDADLPAPAIWIRRDDDVLSIVERSSST